MRCHKEPIAMRLAELKRDALILGLGENDHRSQGPEHAFDGWLPSRLGDIQRIGEHYMFNARRLKDLPKRVRLGP